MWIADCGECRPFDKVGGGEGGSPFGPQFGPKIRGRGHKPLPWICPCNQWGKVKSQMTNAPYTGPYLGFFVCGGKLGFREISDQYSYKKQPSKIRHYVRKKTFSFPGGGNCPLRPPAMYGPDTSHSHSSTVV